MRNTPHHGMSLASLLVLLACFPAAAQDPKLEGAPKKAGPFILDQRRVDEAIKGGVEYLRGSGSPGAHQGISNCDELVLLTFIHAGVPEIDKIFQDYFQRILQAPLEKTYKVSLQAMCLEEMDRVKYQPRIRQCAQFLVDNQCGNGQWTYGEPTPAVPDTTEVPTSDGGRAEMATSGGSKKAPPGPPPYDPALPVYQRVKSKVVQRVEVRRTRNGPPEGDNSNSQYAALGLRACHDSGILLPAETISKASSWWRGCQHAGPGGTAEGKGWCYKDGHPPYCSMTAGALGALIIYDYIQGKDWKADANVQAAMRWMIEHFTVTENFGPPEHREGNLKFHYYYYLYALERAGMLYGTEKLGSHEWYPEGAKVLLEAQKGGGSWFESDSSNSVWDTCFAVLFLRRATRPLGQDVATGGPRPK